MHSVPMEITGVEKNLKRYYDDKIVAAVVGIVVDVNRVEAVAKSLSVHKNVEDVFIVTGEFDIIIKVRFPEFWILQEFLMEELSKIPGIRGSKTMMVLTAVKDMGQILMG